MPKILVVDDNIDMLETLEHLFSFYDYEVVKAENGQEGIKCAEEAKPDIILLDALMPVMNGFETCGQLKANQRTKDIPIIFLSANYTEEKHRNRGIDLGADDYILKPFNAKDLLAKVNTLLQKKQIMLNLRVDNRRILERHNDIDKEIEELKKRSAEIEPNQSLDQLTGVYNNAYFREFGEQMLSKSIADEDEVSLLYLDIDFFQRINNTFGEQAGDYVLMRMANVVLKNTKSAEFVFRLSKDKFGVLLPSKDESAAFFEAEKLRTVVQQTDFFNGEVFQLKNLSHRGRQESRQITVSVGLAGSNADSGLSSLMRQADDALTHAKASGRNMAVRYSEIGEYQVGK